MKFRRLAIFVVLTSFVALSIACGGGSSPSNEGTVSPFDKAMAFKSNLRAATMAICADVTGGFWITGFFEGNFTVEETVYVATSSRDVFAIHLNAAGEVITVSTAFGDDEDTPLKICGDGLGGVWVAGMYREDCNFGTHTINASGKDDIFLAHLSAAGVWESAVTIGSNSMADISEYVYGVCPDGSNGCWLAATFMTSFSIGASAVDLMGTENSFAVRRNADSTWGPVAVTEGTDRARIVSLCEDGSGGCWVGGFFNLMLTLGSSSLYAGITMTETVGDIFVARVSSVGEWNGMVSPLGSFNLVGEVANLSLAPSSSNSVVIAGGLAGNAMFGSLQTLATGSAGKDAFVAKLNSSLDWVYAKAIPNVISTVLTTTTLGTHLLTGTYADAVQFGPVVLQATNPELFAAELLSNGTWTGAVSSTGLDNGVPFGAIRTGANVWMTGYFSGSLRFGDKTLTSSSLAAFIARAE